jgi:hypothetical protein
VNETQIEGGGVNLLSYIESGDEHTVLRNGPFYTETIDGEKLVDWVTRLVKANRSTTCTARSAASAERPGHGCLFSLQQQCADTKRTHRKRHA